MRLALRFISGKYQGGEFPLEENREVIVGRSSDLDMVLVEEMVSRRHARIQLVGGSVNIDDLGSTNGTFVDGELAAGDMPLSPGATIRFGEVTVLFEPLDNDTPLEPPGTRVVERLIEPTPFVPPEVEPVAATERRRPAPRAPRPEPVPQRKSRWWMLLLLAALAAAAAYLYLQP